jgi:Arc/MetJ family transcription regulator
MKTYQVSIPMKLVFQVDASTKKAAINKALKRQTGHDLRAYKMSEIEVKEIKKA